jgi:thimet oligopeptidase
MSQPNINVIIDYSNLTESSIDQVKTTYIHDYDQVVEKVLAVPNDELSWTNLVQPFIDLDNAKVSHTILEMKDFYTEESIREKCNDVATELESWSIEQSMRKDIYLKYKHYATNKYLQEVTKLSAEQVSYFQDLMTGYAIKGMELPDDKFALVVKLKKEISELCSEFHMNLGNENYSEFVNQDQLQGLPEKYIEERLQPDHTVKVTLKYPDYVPIMEYAKNRDTRKHFSQLFKSRCIKENTPIIEKVFKLRGEMAELFGFTDYSDYKLQQSMAESTHNVMNFMNELLDKVKPLHQTDMEQLSKLALSDGITQLEIYDIAYYSRIFVEQTCAFDKEELKKYFPVSKVISGAFEIYQTLLGYKFTQVIGQESTFWHSEVELYQVTDSETNQTVGYFYLDLYPREGKYSHAACFPFITKSSVTLPVATMACNFNKGNLSFDEVETFFHEFGHVMHHLSSISTISDTSGFACEHDFVETPSQMFEEWCYAKDTLQMMSEGLPDEMVVKLNQSRKLLQGYHYARQLLFGLFDMTMHSQLYNKNSLNPAETFSQLQKEVLHLDTVPDTSEPASFGHLLGGYDAGYYGYAWSLVYAKDLFSEFKKAGLLNKSLGKKLRDEVLSQGSIRKSIDSVKIFLDREPNSNEFINSVL